MNHRIVGFSLPFALTGSFVFSALSAAFATVPDSIEGRRLILKHRGISHNLLFWLVLFTTAGTGFLLLEDRIVLIYPILPFLLKSTGLSLFTGVLTHIIADSMTITGVPLSPVGRRFALKLFRTGQPVEYFIALGVLFVACLVNYKLFLSFYSFLNNPHGININELRRFL